MSADVSVDDRDGGEAVEADVRVAFSIGILIVSLLLGGLLIAGRLLIIPKFEVIFLDLGISLPRVTVLVLQPWLLPSVGIAVIGLGVVGSCVRGTGAIMAVLAIVLGLGGMTFACVALFTPLMIIIENLSAH